MAYIRAVEANTAISGIFNIASGNHTVGEVADLVRSTLGEELGQSPTLDINHIQDIRNYKVSIERAKNILSFHPHHDVKAIVRNLIEHMPKCNDWNNPNYYNIQVFKTLESGDGAKAMTSSVGVTR
jgi:nucleoside-diphosphate-sugar epimerase